MKPLPFDRMNEADVREEIIAPLIRRLGYQSGSVNDVVREQSLRYPLTFLGRKKSSDLPLRGIADYILRVGDRLNLVVEAKPPYPDITEDDIEQTWTYANHAEIRAVYFVVCNGRTLQIFLTRDAPISGPVATFDYEEFDARFGHLSNILSPEAVLRDFPNIVPDYGMPLGPGLRSYAKGAGCISYFENTAGSVALQQLLVQFECAIERVDGQLVVNVDMKAPISGMRDAAERMGLNSIEMVSADSLLSGSAEDPTVFTYEKQLAFGAGEEFPNIDTWQTELLPVDFIGNVRTVARCHLVGRHLTGTFETTLQVIGHEDLGYRHLGAFDADLT